MKLQMRLTMPEAPFPDMLWQHVMYTRNGVSSMSRQLNVKDAINEALATEMELDSRIF